MAQQTALQQQPPPLQLQQPITPSISQLQIADQSQQQRQQIQQVIQSQGKVSCTQIGYELSNEYLLPRVLFLICN